MKHCLTILSGLISLVTIVPSCTHKSAEDQFIDDLLARMTLEEKIGQLNQLDPPSDNSRLVFYPKIHVTFLDRDQYHCNIIVIPL